MNPKLRDSGLSALVALGLFGVMLGLRTDSGPNGLFLVPRPMLLLYAVAAVFLLASHLAVSKTKRGDLLV